MAMMPCICNRNPFKFPILVQGPFFCMEIDFCTLQIFAVVSKKFVNPSPDIGKCKEQSSSY